MSRGRPPAAIQVDLDGLWALLGYYGRRRDPREPDPAFDSGLPAFLELFARLGIRATLFATGRDCEVPERARLLRAAAGAGHEVANHTLSHAAGFSRLATDDLSREIAGAHERIAECTGVAPVGFRAPGYDFDERVLDRLEQSGYLYDASLLPTWAAPALRAADALLGGMRVSPRQYGRAVYGRAPLFPYRPRRGAAWRAGSRRLVEVPVGVVPGWRLPFHGTIVALTGEWWFRWGLARARAAGGPLAYLFHALELADLGSVALPPQTARVFGQPLAVRAARTRRIVEAIARDWRPVTTRELACTAAR